MKAFERFAGFAIVVGAAEAFVSLWREGMCVSVTTELTLNLYYKLWYDAFF